ncbi:MAG: hypothetical protein NVS2B16_11910 [Chloroflexota bacterium]
MGIVESAGSGVSKVKEGDWVALPWLGYACEACEYCSSGWETLCESQFITGDSFTGTNVEYARRFAKNVGEVPKNVDSPVASPLPCAGAMTDKAVKVSSTRSLDLPAVFGVEGIGHLAREYAVIARATVVAVAVVNEKLEMARSLSAIYMVNARREDPVEFIKTLGGADAAIPTAASAGPIEQPYQSLRRRGTLVTDLPVDDSMQVPIFQTVLNGIHIIASI